MKTNDLIRTLASDRQAGMPMGRAWLLGAVAAIILSAVTFLLLLGPRPDIAEAAETWRFLWKFVVTMLMAFAVWSVIRPIAEPGSGWRAKAFWLAIAPALLIASAMLEMMLLPEGERMQRMIGTNNMLCLLAIPAIGLPGLGAFLAVLRHGAPVDPGWSGALAGLLAGGIAATFYAAHCTDDSPLFVMVWYTLGIGILAIVGAVVGRMVARW